MFDAARWKDQADSLIEALPDEPQKRGLRDAITRVLSKTGASESIGWRDFTLKDAYAPREPLVHIVEDVITAGSLSIFYGAPGTFKSMLLIIMLLCVAAGIDWLKNLYPGGAGKKTVKVTCAWLDFDNGLRRTLERFEAAGRACGIKPKDVDVHIFSMPSPWLDASSTDSIGDLADRVNALNIKLLVIDNLGRITGDADLNTSDMARVMGNLRWLVEHTGAAVVLIHHQRKSNGSNGRSGEALLGHTSIEAAIDLALLVEREDRSNFISVKSTKTRDVDVRPFGAQFVFEHKPNSKELATAQFIGMPINDVIGDEAVRNAVVEAVSGKRPINQTNLVNAVKAALPDVGANRIRLVIESMCTSGELTSSSGAHGAKLYDLP